MNRKPFCISVWVFWPPPSTLPASHSLEPDSLHWKLRWRDSAFHQWLHKPWVPSPNRTARWWESGFISLAPLLRQLTVWGLLVALFIIINCFTSLIKSCFQGQALSLKFMDLDMTSPINLHGEGLDSAEMPSVPFAGITDSRCTVARVSGYVSIGDLLMSSHALKSPNQTVILCRKLWVSLQIVF